MSNANLPNTYWDEIFSSIVYIINRLPSHNSTIPYTTLFRKQPNRVLGCACFPYTRPYNSHKLDLRALTCVFVGYSTTQKGYRCLHIPTNKIYVSRHVQFDELFFPFKTTLNKPASLDQSGSPSNQTVPLSVFRSVLAQNLPETAQVLNPSIYAGPTSTNTPRPNIVSVTTTSTQQQAQQQLPLNSPARHEIILPNRSPNCPILSDRNFSSTSPSAETSETSTLAPDTPITIPVTEIPPPTQHPAPPKHPMITRTRDNTRKPRHFPDFVAHLTTLDHEPSTFSQANTRPEWRQAMSVEIDALAANNTWTLVPPPLDQAIIGCKWVYRIKRRSDGTIDRYKARLVAKGFLQQEGVDFFDTFSPVVRPTTIRVILSLAVSHKWSIRQLDVNNAFLHGDLKERVFMSQPPGFIDPTRPDHVCLLSKSLYGLKQSPRAWFQKLSSTLFALGFLESQYDPSLFISHAHNHLTMILVYVDDILITGTNPSLISSYISHLHNSFSLKDLGDINFFLGIQITKTPTGLHLNQSKYIHDILVKANMVHAKHAPTPMSTSISLSTDDSALFDNPKLFRSIIGSLQYATLTRPDISFAVNKVSQFMQNPTINHWAAVKRILRFLCGTIRHGLHLQAGSPLDINAYCDADWAGCPVDRRSTTGFCIYLGKNLVSWSAKKQPTVSRSSTEAEYRALAVTCAELLWLRYLLQELRVMPSTPPTIWCDNIGATFLASNPIFHARTKHIEIDFHFCRERIINKEIQVRFLSSSDQIADALTKPLALSRFQFLCNKLTVVPPSTA
ncbi:polyprotein [Rhynchospora pubera]|uniref:Polyprotein n=1 Tax=Rhynchospora pubera TaxID=906938 RepID=A0AAV8CEB9_9POAL|nr:polyprotein [Rhynchospora pubera]